MNKIKFSKKMVYSTLAVIGLMGSTGGIIGGVVTNNNLQTSQTISSINEQIQSNNNDLYSSQNSNNTTTSNNNSSDVDTSNADVYNNEFLTDLNNYNDVDYTTNLSILRQSGGGTSSVSDTNFDYNGDLTTNSVLNTTKDNNEISLENKNSIDSNVYNTIKQAITTYKNDWFNDLQNATNNLNNLITSNFVVKSIKTITQYAWIDWYGLGDYAGTLGGKVFHLYNTFDTHDSVAGTQHDASDSPYHGQLIYRDPNNALAGYVTHAGDWWGHKERQYFFDGSSNDDSDNDDKNAPMEGSGPSQGADDANNSALYGATTQLPSTLHWSYGNQNLIGTDAVKNGFYFEIDPFYYTSSSRESTTNEDANHSDGLFPGDIDGESWNYDNGDSPVTPASPIPPGPKGEWKDKNSDGAYVATKQGGDHYIVTHVPAIVYNTVDDNTVDFENFGNSTSGFNGGRLGPNYLKNLAENSTVTFNTIPDNDTGFYGLWQPIPCNNIENRYYDIYRGLLQWNLTKLPDSAYKIDSNTYALQYNGKDLIDVDGQSTSNFDWVDSNYANDYFTIVNNGDYSNTKIVTPSEFYSYISPDLNTLTNMYKTDQLKNIMEQINQVQDGISVTNLNDIKIDSNNYIFGKDTPFNITTEQLPSSFNTNYGSFDVTINQNNNNNIYLFNNFLPILASQIVIDPTSANSTYNQTNSSTNIYTQSNPIKFKLSENMGELLDDINFYNTYKDWVNSIDINKYGGSTSSLGSDLIAFQNAFNNFSFTSKDESKIKDFQTLLENFNPKDLSEVGTNKDPDVYINNPNQQWNVYNNSTFEANRNNLESLIQKIFNDNNLSNLTTNDANGNLVFNDNIRQTLCLIPTAVKNAMTNLDIVADYSYDGSTWDQGTTTPAKIWDSTNQMFNDFSLTPQGTNNIGNNNSEIIFKNIRFAYKDDSTINGTNDAYTDNMNFLNNGLNNNLDYMLNEYNSYYPNEDSITIDNNSNTITYKLHYNPNFSNWTNPSDSLDNQGIAIKNTVDTTGYLASQYTDNTLNTNIFNAINNWFGGQVIMDINKYPIYVVNNSNLNSLPTQYANNKTKINDVIKNNNLNITPDDNSGTFYALVTITNSQNFANPEGDNNGKLDNGKMYWISTNSDNNEIRTYLVEMNAAKKEINLSDVQFNVNTTNNTEIDWILNSNTNYYYQTAGNNTSQILLNNGIPTTNQTITINNKDNPYIKILDDCTNDSNNINKIKAQLNNWFAVQYPNQNIYVNTLTINYNQTNDIITLNYTLNT